MGNKELLKALRIHEYAIYAKYAFFLNRLKTAFPGISVDFEHFLFFHLRIVNFLLGMQIMDFS